MKIRLSRNILEIRRGARIKEMGKIAPLITGSLGQIQRKCGNPNCRCAKGEKHPAWILTWKEKKKTTGLYVPVDQVKEVQKWIQEYRRV